MKNHGAGGHDELQPSHRVAEVGCSLLGRAGFVWSHTHQQPAGPRYSQHTSCSPGFVHTHHQHCAPPTFPAPQALGSKYTQQLPPTLTPEEQTWRDGFTSTLESPGTRAYQPQCIFLPAPNPQCEGLWEPRCRACNCPECSLASEEWDQACAPRQDSPWAPSAPVQSQTCGCTQDYKLLTKHLRLIPASFHNQASLTLRLWSVTSLRMAQAEPLCKVFCCLPNRTEASSKTTAVCSEKRKLKPPERKVSSSTGTYEPQTKSLLQAPMGVGTRSHKAVTASGASTRKGRFNDSRVCRAGKNDVHSCTCLKNELDKTSMQVSNQVGPRKGV